MSAYLTVNGEFENTIVIERSKFICSIKGISDEAEAKAYIEEIRKRYSLANHHTYAYIADDKGYIQKFSDNGEPQGTAGLPMLGVLKNRKIFKAVAVVTRFWGGIKLGAGGLVRAYSGSVAECLNKSDIKEIVDAFNFVIKCDYDVYARLIKSEFVVNYTILKTDFDFQVEMLVTKEKHIAEKFENIVLELNNLTGGKITIIREEDSKRAF